ncbi:hypothetical protein ASF61_09530 [Duganella sp. Leaf126]|uniref:YciI family protein n=1 Tax=Duganella sp. Leaf126 TaxID=1736266 RepID=UPI0006FA93DF|nr:YciI family protein [Duganella sp. Leaf126]KQQ33323.1 hypothetical protein ASF61_09530 [Duganella sp. Leaf126]
MEFVVLRRANQSTERGDQPPALEPGVFLRPSDSALRLTHREGVWRRSSGPYAPREVVAGLTLVQAPSRADVIEQVRWWPLFDAGAVYEIRDQGPAVTGSGHDAIPSPVRNPDWTRYLVFLRADADSEAEPGVAADAAAEARARMRAHEERSVQAGVLLAGSALGPTRTATRVRFANANTSLVPGPFTDVQELVAGYWIIQAATLDAAIAWACGCPYPQAAAGAGTVTVEIREVCERREQREFTPEMRAAEEKLRAELLEGVLREALQKRQRMF